MGDCRALDQWQEKGGMAAVLSLRTLGNASLYGQARCSNCWRVTWDGAKNRRPIVHYRAKNKGESAGYTVISGRLKLKGPIVQNRAMGIRAIPVIICASLREYEEDYRGKANRPFLYRSSTSTGYQHGGRHIPSPNMSSAFCCEVRRAPTRSVGRLRLRR